MNNPILDINYNLVTDYTEELNDFLDESVTLSIQNTEYLYLGREKPFNQIYIQSSTPSSSKISFTIEYYNGSSWESVLNINDGTKKFTRDGFICWQEHDDNTDIEELTLAGKEQYWYRLQPSAQLDITFDGIGVMFSEDRLLYQARPILDDNDYRTAVVGGDSKYTRVHLEVKDEILQYLKDQSIIKYESKTTPDQLRHIKSMNEWDLFDLTEVKQAGKLLALSKIYYSLSDTEGDKWELEARRFKEDYFTVMDVIYMSLDFNNDGKLQHFETMKRVKRSTMTR